MTDLPSLLFINRSYWPDSEATGQLLTDLAESLSQDFDVHVLCGQPNSETSDRYTRSGVQKRGGVNVHRIWHTTFAKRIPAGRILNLLWFTFAAKRYLKRSDLSVDVIISETDPFLLPIVAANHADRCGARFIAYLQDIYPDVAEAVGKAKPGLTTRLIRRRLRDSYERADKVIVLGNCMRQRLVRKPWAIASDKIEVIANWADCEKIFPIAHSENRLRERQNWQNRFVVMHSGNMGMTQRLENLVAATQLSGWPSSALLTIVGDGAARPHLQKLADASENDRVVLLPYQPRDELADSLSAADVHVVSMDSAITGCLCPSKLYGILAAGRPLIAVCSNDTDLAAVTTQRNIGLVVPPESPEQFAAAVASFVSDQNSTAAEAGIDSKKLGINARQLAIECYDRPVILAKIRRLIDSLLNPQN